MRLNPRQRTQRSFRPTLEQLEGRLALATVLGVTEAGALIRFDSTTPGTVTTTPITGLVSGDTVVGIDFRPATGQLFALGSGSRLYTINPATGAVTQVGAAGAFTLTGTAFGFDFNPVPDRIRVVSLAGQNLRLNPNDGTLTATDTILAFDATTADGDPIDANAGANPNVVAAGYTNSVAGATTTTLFGIDTTLDVLVVQDPPNAGTLNTVGPLGINATDVAALDIQPLPGGGNTAFAALTTDGTASALYSINLTTGAATLVGNIGSSATLVRALAIASAGTFQFSAATFAVGESGPSAIITVNRVGGSEGTATVTLATTAGTATPGSDFIDSGQVLTFGPGVTTQTVQIPIEDDALVEADETVNLALSSPTGGAALGTQATAVLTIADDDEQAPPPTPTTNFAGIVDDPDNPGQGLLLVTGTAKNDVIVIEPRPKNRSQTRVLINGRVVGTFNNNAYQRIAALGLAGHDTLVVNATLNKPAELHGNEGHDALFGGAAGDSLFGEDGHDSLFGRRGNDSLDGGDGHDALFGAQGHDLLLGGDGNDSLFGQQGRDLLMACDGIDFLHGGADDDVLIGDRTEHDEDLAARAALHAEIIAGGSAAARIARLRGTQTGGLNDPFFLTPGGTIVRDRSLDVLVGAGGSDWFVISRADGDKAAGATSKDRVDSY